MITGVPSRDELAPGGPRHPSLIQAGRLAGTEPSASCGLGQEGACAVESLASPCTSPSSRGSARGPIVPGQGADVAQGVEGAGLAAIKEYGALRRTVYAARYLADETYGRRIARQLTKGENLHSLRRSLAHAGEGALHRHHHEQQTEQMWCLTLATNAVVTWITEYHGLAAPALRRAGLDIDDAVLVRQSPVGS